MRALVPVVLLSHLLLLVPCSSALLLCSNPTLTPCTLAYASCPEGTTCEDRVVGYCTINNETNSNSNNSSSNNSSSNNSSNNNSSNNSSSSSRREVCIVNGGDLAPCAGGSVCEAEASASGTGGSAAGKKNGAATVGGEGVRMLMMAAVGVLVVVGFG